MDGITHTRLFFLFTQLEGQLFAIILFHWDEMLRSA